jgi:hypothetical protein
MKEKSTVLKFTAIAAEDNDHISVMNRIAEHCIESQAFPPAPAPLPRAEINDVEEQMVSVALEQSMYEMSQTFDELHHAAAASTCAGVSPNHHHHHSAAGDLAKSNHQSSSSSNKYEDKAKKSPHASDDCYPLDHHLLESLAAMGLCGCEETEWMTQLQQLLPLLLLEHNNLLQSPELSLDSFIESALAQPHCLQHVFEQMLAAH